MKFISTKGDDGYGNYAGVCITVFRYIKFPLFWIGFFANDPEARTHDTDDDSTDWTNPELGYAYYKQITEKFHAACLLRAGENDKYILDTEIAYWLAKRWGDFKYECVRKPGMIRNMVLRVYRK